MTNDKRHDLRKRYLALKKALRDLDFKLSEWARDLRAAVATDDEFSTWCADELGLALSESAELIQRAAAVRVVSDADTWAMLGGFIKVVKLLPLSAKEQVACVNAVKASGTSLDSVLRQRGHTNAGTGRTSAVPVANPDAAVLARFIADTLKTVPPKIGAIVERYTKETV